MQRLSVVILLVSVLADYTALAIPCPFEALCECQPFKASATNFSSVVCDFNGQKATLPAGADKFEVDYFGVANFTDSITNDLFARFSKVRRLIVDFPKPTEIGFDLTMATIAPQNIGLEHLATVNYIWKDTSFEKLKSLTSLTKLQAFIDDSQLAELSSAIFANLVSLTDLALDGFSVNFAEDFSAPAENKLSHLALRNSQKPLPTPAQLTGFTNLVSLNYAGATTPFSTGMVKIDKLTAVGLSQMQLQNIDLAKELPTNLAQLDISATGLREFPALGSLLKLKQLDLSFNSISSISAESQTFGETDSITLRSNPISKLVIADSLKKTKSLDLSSTKLSEFDFSFADAAWETINLSYNTMMHLRHSDTSKFPKSLKQVTVRDSMLLIDRSLINQMATNKDLKLDLSFSRIICVHSMRSMADYVHCDKRITAFNVQCINGGSSLADYLSGHASCLQGTTTAQPISPTTSGATSTTKFVLTMLPIVTVIAGFAKHTF